MTTESINHIGQITAIHQNSIDVLINSESACASCHANGACSSADSSEKMVTVKNSPQYQNLKEGDIVTLNGNFTSGLKAVSYAYVLPFILVILTLVVASEISQNNLLSGLLALGILVPYYGILYALRSKFEKEFSFSIKTEV